MGTIASRTSDQDRIRELENLVDRLLVSVTEQQDHIAALERNVAALTYDVQKLKAQPQYTIQYNATVPSFTTQP